jgi:HlyD family secretion protein
MRKSLVDRQEQRPEAPATGLGVTPVEGLRYFRAARRDLRVALVVVVVFALGIGLMLTRTVIAGAVVASGMLVVESGPKAVQHPTGGVVSALLVSEGDTVVAGQPLIRLDPTAADAQFNTVAVTLAQQQARLARMLAERDGLDAVDFASVDTGTDLAAGQYAAIIASETTQFRLRRDDRDGQRQQLRERIAQAQREIEGQQAQLAALVADTGLVEAKLAKLRPLLAQSLISADGVYDLERTLRQSQGSEGQLRAAIAANEGRIAELQLSIIAVDQTLRADLTDQIAAAQSEIATLGDRLIVARQALRDLVIPAPQSGRVLDLQVHTVGGVVTPAQTLLTIVPEADALVGEVRISPADIDQLYPGQTATLQFSAFDRGTTPAVVGHLASVSADLVEDKRNGAMYYLARVTADPRELARLGGLTLMPGMPIEVFIQTGERTIMSYLTKPLTDQMNRAFRS